MRISDWSSDVCSSDLQGASPASIIDGNVYATGDIDAGGYAAAHRQRRLCFSGQHFRDRATDRVRELRHNIQGRIGLPVLDKRNVGGRDAGLLMQHRRSEEHTSELQSLMRISYAVFCLQNTKLQNTKTE